MNLRWIFLKFSYSYRISRNYEIFQIFFCEDYFRLKVHKIEIFFGFDFEICIFSLLVIVKVAVRIHYSNTDRLLRHWIYSGNQLMFSLFWVPDPESTARNMMRRIVTPIIQWSKLRPCLGEGIYAVSSMTFLLVSKNHDVDDDQLYFMSNSTNTEPYRGGFVYRMELVETCK